MNETFLSHFNFNFYILKSETEHIFLVFHKAVLSIKIKQLKVKMKLYSASESMKY